MGLQLIAREWLVEKLSITVSEFIYGIQVEMAITLHDVHYCFRALGCGIEVRGFLPNPHRRHEIRSDV
jgi:hypothetical protein